MQRIRTRENEIKTRQDREARKLYEDLLATPMEHDPWCDLVQPRPRKAKIGRQEIKVQASTNFDADDAPRNAARLLVSLRDAAAQGDARKVVPFHERVRGERLLVGFTFTCENREKTWKGTITLLESDLRRIGGELAERYFDALGSADSQFGSDAARSVRKIAA